jgi:hypothetical protein
MMNSSRIIPLETKLPNNRSSVAQVWGVNRSLLLLTWNTSLTFSTIKMSSIKHLFPHVMPFGQEASRKSPIGDLIAQSWFVPAGNKLPTFPPRLSPERLAMPKRNLRVVKWLGTIPAIRSLHSLQSPVQGSHDRHQVGCRRAREPSRRFISSSLLSPRGPTGS